MKNKIYLIAVLIPALACMTACSKKEKEEGCNTIVAIESGILSPLWLVHLKDSLDNHYGDRCVPRDLVGIKYQGENYILFLSYSSSTEAMYQFYTCSGVKVKYASSNESGLYRDLLNVFTSGNYIFLFRIYFGLNCTPPIIEKP